MPYITKSRISHYLGIAAHLVWFTHNDNPVQQAMILFLAIVWTVSLVHDEIRHLISEDRRNKS